MFLLSTLEDKIRIAPENLGKPTEAAITTAIENTFLDRVVPDLGLIVTLYDILRVGDGHVYHSDGGAHYLVSFRVVAFRPFPGETLVGQVAANDEKDGLRVSLGFFRDVVITPSNMNEEMVWDPHEPGWCWPIPDGRLYFENGQDIRFKVASVAFHTKPTLLEQREQEEAGEAVVGSAARPFVPMLVSGRAEGDGLGMLHWYLP